MQNNYQIVDADEHLVEEFVKKLNTGAVSFRYYNKRPVQIINNHLITLVIKNEYNIPVAYGHLDKENGTLWLGIAVADNYLNKGLGSLMMQHLVDFARSHNEPVITLSVDIENVAAQHLYGKFGFKKKSDMHNHLIYELKLI